MPSKPFRRELNSHLVYLGQTRAMRAFAVQENVVTVEHAATATDAEMASAVENHCIENNFRVFYEKEQVSIIDLETKKEWRFGR